MRLKLGVSLLVAVAAVLAGFASLLVPGVMLFDLKAFDWQFRQWADPAKADTRIVLVEVDQASIDHFEKDNIPFPWPRSIYNPLIEYCTAGGAKVILFDIIFNDMSPYGVEIDEDFAEAIRKAGNVYLAASFSGDEPAEPLLLEERYSLPLAGDALEGVKMSKASLPLPVFQKAVRGLGSVTNDPDLGGVFRRVAPFVEVGGRLVPSLAAAPLMTSAVQAEFRPGALSVGAVTVPVDEAGNMWIRYHGPRGTYRRVSAAGVISSALRTKEGLPPTVPKETFRDAYVIVGYSAPGIYDLKPTPLSARSPGAEVHAAALDNLINGDFIAEAPTWGTLLMALAVAAAVSAAVLFIFRIWISAIAVICSITAVFIAVGQTFQAGYLFDLWVISAAIVLSLIGSAVYRYQTEGKRRRFIYGAFSRYVSPHVLKELTAHPERLALHGERKNLTLMFSDLTGFTALSEDNSPEDVVRFLNWHMTAMTRIIHRNGGTVQKFLGDGIYAFWGDFVEDSDHALHACLAAAEMQEENERIRAEPFAKKFPEVGLRVGINTGPVVVGNMGSDERFDYCPIGDSVNLAARLEGVNKLYGTGILMSGATREQLGGRIPVRRVDRVCVKGKARPIEIFTCCGDEALGKRSEEAVQAYRRQEWDRAEVLWQAVRREFPHDSIASLYLDRIVELRKEPPGEGWDGAVSLEKM